MPKKIKLIVDTYGCTTGTDLLGGIDECHYIRNHYLIQERNFMVEHLRIFNPSEILLSKTSHTSEADFLKEASDLRQEGFNVILEA